MGNTAPASYTVHALVEWSIEQCEGVEYRGDCRDAVVRKYMWILDGSQEGWYDVLQTKGSGGPQTGGVAVVPPTQDHGASFINRVYISHKTLAYVEIKGFACATNYCNLSKCCTQHIHNIFIDKSKPYYICVLVNERYILAW